MGCDRIGWNVGRTKIVGLALVKTIGAESDWERKF